ncbi:protein kinase [Histomonas meleagridis]|uniref:protein kinase n=1 Tax=Histomonas meleagridis TaxID=135588 RepID=UPI003559DBA9|nr:protein kinase [Histomonas meleagridis]KAH0805100.1 protein kinase [Histomonas meleagridis]
MGSGFSANYDLITPVFISDFWKVHTAIRKSTGENVTIWIFDEQLMISNNIPKEDCDKYISSCIYSIQQIRKLHHPNILKIIEFDENSRQPAFVSETICSSLTNENDLTGDEIEYIGKQLISVLSFLHNNAKISHLGINPNAIFLTKDLTVKLNSFNFSSPISDETSLIKPIFGKWKNLSTYPNLNFSSPELISNKDITTKSDIFSFGVTIASAYLKKPLFSSKSPDDYLSQLSNDIVLTLPHATQSIVSTIKSCLAFDPENRPTLSSLENSEAFNSIHIKVYRYFDEIIVKAAAEKFNFFKSLTQSLSIFSHRMIRYKFMPVFINETLSDTRYAPVTIPLIFQGASFYSKRDFNNEILSKFSSFLVLTKPPELMLSVFSILKILIDKTEPEQHYKVIFPIFREALNSNDIRLHNTAIKNLPLIVKTLDSKSIQKSVIPKLTEFISSSDDTRIVSSSIVSLGDCLCKVNHNTFANLTLPQITETWRKLPSDDVANAIMTLLGKLNLTIETSLENVVPLASTMLSTPQMLTIEIQINLIKLCQNILSNIKQVQPSPNTKLPEKKKKKLIVPEQIEPLKRKTDTIENWNDTINEDDTETVENIINGYTNVRKKPPLKTGLDVKRYD